MSPAVVALALYLFVGMTFVCWYTFFCPSRPPIATDLSMAMLAVAWGPWLAVVLLLTVAWAFDVRWMRRLLEQQASTDPRIKALLDSTAKQRAHARRWLVLQLVGGVAVVAATWIAHACVGTR